MKRIAISVLALLLFAGVSAQHIQHDLPKQIDRAGFYLFYLHGGVVTVKGDNAINDPVPHLGPYQYSRILDTLRAHGFHVISERRFPGIEDSLYARKIARQVDTLVKANVPVSNIIIVGASAGSNIVLLASDLLQDRSMRFVIMGGCSPDIYKEYSKLHLVGDFLSIIESSDNHGTCERIFESRGNVVEFHEVTLSTGLDHGFIYKPFAAWIDPLVQWFQMTARSYRARKPSLIDGH